MTLAPAVKRFFDQIELPADPALPRLAALFDAESISQTIQDHLPDSYGEPEHIRIHHFIHSIGRRALVSYEVSWPEERYLPPEYLVLKTSGAGPIELSRYPHDDRLPGLAMAAQPASTLDLVNAHVLGMPARRASVNLVRYRPEFRAVLRHRIGRVRLYARVMRPADVRPIMATHQVATASSFVVPGLAGCWHDGGVVWLTEIRGRNLRRCIRKGRFPDPAGLLGGLESLWNIAPESPGIRPFDLSRAWFRALKSFRHNLRDHADASQALKAIANSLTPFVKSWKPSCMAHNDFYDDQLLLMEDGKIALVDLEDIAPGDPMLDVGNFLAHLRWMTQSGSRDHADNCETFHHALRGAALERFRWDSRDLALREAVCLFRICTNVIRHPRQNWHRNLEAGLALVNETMG